MTLPEPQILVLPCGCVMGNDEKVFFISPCSLVCENYFWVVEESRKHGNEIMYIKVVNTKK